MHRSTRDFEVLKIGAANSLPLVPKWCSYALPHRRIFLSNAPPNEQSSSAPVGIDKAYKHANTCFVTLYMMMPFIPAEFESIKSENVSKQVKAPLTPKHGKDCVSRVLYTYQQQSLEPLQRYVFQIVQCRLITSNNKMVV